MFDIRRLNSYIFGDNEDNLIMEFSGKSAQLNSFLSFRNLLYK